MNSKSLEFQPRFEHFLSLNKSVVNESAKGQNFYCCLHLPRNRCLYDYDEQSMYVIFCGYSSKLTFLRKESQYFSSFECLPESCHL